MVSITNLDDGNITTFGGLAASVDIGRDAVVEGDGSAFTSMYVWLNSYDIGSLSFETVGTDLAVGEDGAGGQIIAYKGELIAELTFYDGSTYVDINFTAAATAEAVQAIIRALTFTAAETLSDTIKQTEINIQVSTENDWFSMYKSVSVLPDGAKVLTSADEVTTGTDGADLWFVETGALGEGDHIDGGAGNDTLQMIDGGTLDLTLPASITGIETIRGSAGGDTFILKASQLDEIRLIDGGDLGGFNQLQVLGDTVDLRGTKLQDVGYLIVDSGATIKFADKDLARYINISGSNLTVDLSGAILSEPELDSFFRKGIETVIDANGTHTNAAPEMTGLDGDTVSTAPGTAVLLDAGADAAVFDDAGSFRALSVAMWSGDTGVDALAIDTSGLVKLNDTNEIIVDGIAIGSLASYGWSLDIFFYDTATPERVQQLLHAISYTYTGSADDIAQSKVVFELTDRGGKTISAAVTVNVAPAGTVSFTSGTDVITGTADDTTYTAAVADITLGDELDGGAGSDTLMLLNGGAFDLTLMNKLTQIEKIVGTDYDDTIVLNASQLAGIEIIDGGSGSWDGLQIVGTDIDLTKTELSNIAFITIIDDDAKIKFVNAAAALKSRIFGMNVVVDVSLSGEELSEADLTALYQNGASSVIDKNGMHTNADPEIAGLDDDQITMAPGATVFLDKGQDAVAMDDSATFKRLEVSFVSSVDGVDVLGIGTTDTVTVEASGDVLVRGVVIGSLTTIGTDALTVYFNDAATKELVSQLLHALTYTYSGDSGDIMSRSVAIRLLDMGGKIAYANVDISIIPPGTLSLTTGADNLTGAAGADSFITTEDSLNAGDQIDGGEGTDTLYLLNGGEFDFTVLGGLKNIETVAGSSANDRIVLNAAHLASLQTIVANTEATGTEFDMIELVGAEFDLRGKAIAGFEMINLATDGAKLTVADKELALSAYAASARNTTLVANGISLSEDELSEIFSHGITTIVDKNGTHTNLPAQIANLSGDKPHVKPGVATFLDVGQDAVLTDDGATMSALWVGFEGSGESTDEIGIDTSGAVSITGDKISVDGVIIGTVMRYTGFTSLMVSFNSEATLARVQEVIRSLTYKDLSTGRTVIAEKTITIALADAQGRGVDFITTVEIVPDGQTPSNHAPTDVTLSTSVLKENTPTGTVIGSLSAQDADVGDIPTFALLDDAGGRFKLDATKTKLVVANAALLDYEKGQSHQIRVKVTDQSGDSIEKTLTVTLTDVLETITGTRGNNTLKGGIGADLLKGGLGNDKMTGGLGKDVFLFNSKLNAKTNLDTIVDFKLKEDKLWLDNAIFKKLGTKTGALNKAFFTVGKAAKDKNDYLVYDKTKGILSYDADGSGLKYKPIAFVKMKAGLSLSASDILIV